MQVAEPLGVALAAWAASAVLNAVLAALLVRALRLYGRSLRLAAWLFLFIFITTAFTLAVGLAGGLRWRVLGGLSAAALVAQLLIPGTRRQLAAMVGQGVQSWAEVRLRFVELPGWLRWTSVVVVVALFVRFSVLISLLPPFVWDSLTYMLTNVAEWTQSGQIGLFDSPVPRTYSAANFEVLATWFVVFLQHDFAVEAAGLPAFALAGVSVYALGRELSLTRAAALIASLAYVLTPAVLIAATGTKNDIHMASYFLFSLLLVVRLARSGRRGGTLELVGTAAVLALTLLLAFGTKAYILHLMPGLALIGLAGLLWRTGRRGVLELAQRLVDGWSTLSGWTRLLFIGLFVLGLGLGGYWNFRNWLVAGNPFYPYNVSVGSSRLAQGVGQTASIDIGRLVDNLSLFVRHFGDRLGPIRPDLPDVTGWGWLAYGLGLPAMIWGLLRRSWLRLLAAGFLLSFLVLMLSTWPSPWHMRYAIWLPGLFSLAIGFWWQRLYTSNSRSLPAFIALFVLLAGLNLATTLNYNKVSPDQFAYMQRFSPWSRNAANLHITVPAEYEHSLVTVPRSARLGYSTHEDGFIYPLYRADFSQNLVYIPLDGEESCQQVAREMQQREVSYLFVSPGHTSDPVLELIMECAGVGGPLHQETRGVYVLD